ncbi:hypothetical protein [Clostridium sp. D5]|uniref:hypothetical protein n=1 Tax=Clostridium sp. D5 TaxID=556261 RepID=UPI0002EA1361|nr:hypothetical protein [Clostridium sp. D5]
MRISGEKISKRARNIKGKKINKELSTTNGKKEKENDTAWNYYFAAGGIFVLRPGASGKVINKLIE